MLQGHLAMRQTWLSQEETERQGLGLVSIKQVVARDAVKCPPQTTKQPALQGSQESEYIGGIEEQYNHMSKPEPATPKTRDPNFNIHLSRWRAGNTKDVGW